MFIKKTNHLYFVDNHYFSGDHGCGYRALQLWSTCFIVVKLLNHICRHHKMEHLERNNHRRKIYYPMVIIM